MYSQTVEKIVDGDAMLTVNAKNSVDEMRSQARGVVAKAIADIREYFGQLFYIEKKSKHKNIAFLDYLWDNLPKLAVTSFISANNANNIVNEKSWAVLMKIQDIGKRTWQMIEQERAAFYLAFYKAIWIVMKKLDIRTELLENPKNLNYTFEDILTL